MRAARCTSSGYLGFCLGFVLCVSSASIAAVADVPPLNDPENRVAQELEHSLQSIAILLSDDVPDLAPLTEFYQRRNYQPAWSTASGVSSGASRWLAVLARLESGTGETDASRLSDIEQRLNATAPAELAELEILLTESFLSYARRIGQGALDPARAGLEWEIPRPELDPVMLLEQTLQTGRFAELIESLKPRHGAYRRLREALARYLVIQQLGGWPGIEASGARLERGHQGDEVQRLREQLWMVGDLHVEDLQGSVYDEVLEQAVRRFQTRHGLQVDGVVGKKTRAAMAVPVEQRIHQIRLNLERWHWVPRDLGNRYILINTAAFELEAYDNDEVSLAMRVIVGKEERPTPVFTENMRYLIVNPYWNVPNKLATHDLIPAQLNDPDYFHRKDIRIFAGWQAGAEEVDPALIDWQAYLGVRYLPYKLQQAPGPANSLGRIKFMLPNAHSVYLHDTPARHLFEKPVRAFSSGCVRVENPLRLADYVLASRSGGSARPDIESIIASGETRTLSLPESIPVYFLYQTAWTDSLGQVHFRDDIYRRDVLLAAALAVTVDDTPLPSIVKNMSQTRSVSLLH